MMALQLYSEYRRFSRDYSNHMTIVYLRQMENFQIFFPIVSISSPATKLTIVSTVICISVRIP